VKNIHDVWKKRPPHIEIIWYLDTPILDLSRRSRHHICYYYIGANMLPLLCKIWQLFC